VKKANEIMKLSTLNICKSYRGRAVVNGVSVEVNQGEIVGLLGPNGAGKTTSFYMMVGLVKPDAGQVFLDDTEITKLPMYKRAQLGLGYLPQEVSVFRKLSVEDNIMAILEMGPLNKTDREAKLERLLEEFSLTHVRKNLGDRLSGGEKRRTEIARALASDPQIILLDEPCTGIDPVTIHSIQDISRGLKNRGISILLTDHRERETLILTDRSYIICGGRVLVSGDAETVLNDPGAIASYFGKRFDVTSIIEGRDSFRRSA
jgi:lipopolysaccharide export system ATP-binding protein